MTSLATRSAEFVAEGPSTIATQASTRAERRWAMLLVGVLATASALAIPFHLHAFASAPEFIPGFAGTTGTADLLAAALLFGVYRVDGTRAVLAAAMAYLLDAFLILPYVLTFPGVVDQYGFIGNEQSAAWLWVTWHVAFPLILLGGTLGGATQRRAEVRVPDVLRAIVAIAVTAAVAIYLVTVQRHVLPVLVSHGRFSHLFTTLSLLAALVNGGVAASFVIRLRPLSTMQLWLAVALAASMLDTALNGISPARYSFAWYVGKADTFVTATAVLLTLLAAWASLYARSSALTQRLAKTVAERRSLQDTLDRERHVSLRLQEASLPARLPVFDHVVFNAAYHPGSDEATIGGDWYDAFLLDDGRVAITIGDVMGSGVHAAVTMTKLRQAMQSAAMLEPDPIAMLDVADHTLRLHDPEGYATALAMIYDPKAHTVSFASAGHLSPLSRSPSGKISEHHSIGVMLGIRSDVPRKVVSIATPPGLMLLLYTDGIIEHDRDLMRGQTRLIEAFADEGIVTAPDPARFIVERVLGAGRATDDVAVLTLSFALRGASLAEQHDVRYELSEPPEAADER